MGVLQRKVDGNMKIKITWFVVAALVLMACAGCGLMEGDSSVSCWHCGDQVKEEYIFYHNGHSACPACVKERLTAPAEKAYCGLCGKAVPEQYICEDFDTDACPECMYEELRVLVSDEVGKCYKCQKFFFYIDSHGLGLCSSCGESELAFCHRCGDPVLEWSEDSEFALCSRCMGIAIEEKRVENALDDFLR